MRKWLGLVLLAAGLVAVGCAREPEQAEPPSWRVKGKVVSIEAAGKRVTVAHEAIPGLMDAMTMAFAVESETLLEGLSEGDAVEFVLEQKPSGLTVTEIGKIEESALAARGKQHTVRGRVLVVNPATYSVMVEHEEVPGVLGADTRVFPVNPASLLEGLEENDRIEFTLTERESGVLVITELKKLPGE